MAWGSGEPDSDREAKVTKEEMKCEISTPMGNLVRFLHVNVHRVLVPGRTLS